MLNLKSISKDLQDAARSVLEAKKEEQVDEALKGNQHKIDANKNGKIDAQDFKLLKKKPVAEEDVDYSDEDIENILENFDQLDELKTSTLGSYTKKALSRLDTLSDMKPKFVTKTGKPTGISTPSIVKDINRQEVVRKKGITKALDRLAKEDVNEVNFADVVARQKAKHGGTLPDKYPAAKKTASNLDVGTSKASKVYSGKPQHKDIFGHDTKSQAAGATGPRASVMQKVHNKIKSFFTKEDIDVILDADEVLLTTPIIVELKESYTFGDYLTAAKAIVGEEHAIELANYAYNKQDTNLFVEQVTRSDIEAKIASHKAAGHDVSPPKYKTKDGKLHAEYVVTDKASGIRRKYIQHGTARKVENMGAKGKRDDE